MVLFDEFSPATIPERGGAFRRADHVGEENRCKHAVEPRFFLANLCEKAYNLINDGRPGHTSGSEGHPRLNAQHAGPGILVATKCPVSGQYLVERIGVDGTSVGTSIEGSTARTSVSR